MRKTASKRHRRKTNGRMTKRVRKSRQSRKRNMYVGGGNGPSIAAGPKVAVKVFIRPLEKAKEQVDKAFDLITTPNITYWNTATLSPFAVFNKDKPGEYQSTYFTIAGIWGHQKYTPIHGYTQRVYKNFDYRTKPGAVIGNASTKQEMRNTYNSLLQVRDDEILPPGAGFKYPQPPVVVVIVDGDGPIKRIISASDPAIEYEKYDRAKHHRPPTYLPVSGVSFPLEATTQNDTVQTGTQSQSIQSVTLPSEDLLTPLL